MNKTQISNILKEELEPYGLLFWHESKHGSLYYKFKDTRLGSIRISDHKGRDKYNYRYELYSDSSKKEDVFSVIVGCIESSYQIEDFDPTKFIVFKNKKYSELNNFKEYRNHILKKK